MGLAVDVLRKSLSDLSTIPDKHWIDSLDQRKLKELEFHDRDRDRSLIESLDSDTYERFYGNKKYYQATSRSKAYVDAWIQEKANGRIFLDYACGNGVNAIKAASAGAELAIGLDISSVSVTNARRDAAEAGVASNSFFVQADAENTKLPNSSIDAIVCSGMLHHLDLQQAFPELQRILAPGGMVLGVEALDYNPLIKLYRQLTPDMRTEWEKAHILSLKDLRFASEFFDIGEVRYWHILSIAGGKFPILLPLLDAMDVMLTRIPGVRLMAWIFTFELKSRSRVRDLDDRLHVWLITIGESLPLAESEDRPWRTGLLARELSGRGHSVVWWTSTVNHFTKKRFVVGQPSVPVDLHLTLQFLDGVLYKKNVGITRIRNHQQIAKGFVTLSETMRPPDIIVCSFPSIELSFEAVRYGKDHGIPVVLDVRDLWPDIFVDVFPVYLRWLARLALRPMFNKTRVAFRGCSNITAVSDGYLEWGIRNSGRARKTDDQVFPLAYPITTSSPEAYAKLAQRLPEVQLGHGDFWVVFVGTFGRSYDLGTVIRAARRVLLGGNRKITFILCGVGESDKVWRTQAADLSNVHFPGWLNADEISALLRNASVGLAAYASTAPQGIPNKVIEYLSVGLPVLCSLSGESRDLLEGKSCGRYYQPGDDDALAKGILALAGDSDLCSEMSRAAKATFESKFSADGVFREMGDYVERLEEQFRSHQSMPEIED